MSNDQRSKRVTVHFDGLCEPKNPGGHGCGGWQVVGLPDGELLGYEHFGKSAYMTNNVAEYRALLSALAALRIAGWAGAVAVRGDSQLVINQLTGEWKAHKEHIRDLRDATLSLLQAFSEVEIAWVPREENSIADALSRKAYAEATGSLPRPLASPVRLSRYRSARARVPSTGTQAEFAGGQSCDPSSGYKSYARLGLIFLGLMLMV